MSPSIHPSVQELAAIESDDEDAFADLLTRWMPIILSASRKFPVRASGRDDYVQAASLALFSVCKNYNLDIDRFVPRALQAIRLAMIDVARRVSTKAALAVAFIPPSEYPPVQSEYMSELDRLVAVEDCSRVRDWWALKLLIKISGDLGCHPRFILLQPKSHGSQIWPKKELRNVGESAAKPRR